MYPTDQVKPGRFHQSWGSSVGRGFASGIARVGGLGFEPRELRFHIWCDAEILVGSWT